MIADVAAEGGKPALDKLMAAPAKEWRAKPGWYWSFGNDDYF
jgi:hypothetical protein